jgi:Predicted membrane protein (DUF2207)
MNKHWMKRATLAVITAFVALFLNCNYAAAQELPFYWDFINVNIDVQTNGDMLVTEEQKYVFTGNHTTQRYCYIPLDRVQEVRDVTVTENGQKLSSKTGIENNQLWIRWDHKLQAPESHNFVLKYRVVGGLQQEGENHRVHWKAIFADRQAPVNKSLVQVKLPESLSGKVTSFNSSGVKASSRQLDPRTIEFTTSQPVPPQKELEVLVNFPAGILNISVQGSGNQLMSWLGSLLGYCILFSPLVIIIAYLRTKGGGGGGGGSGSSRKYIRYSGGGGYSASGGDYSGGGDYGGGSGGGGGG